MGAPRSPISSVVRYGLAGLFAAALYFVLVAGLVDLAGVGPVRSAAAATVVVIVTSYVVNRRFVFETDRPHLSAFTRFVLASCVSILLNTGLMHLAVNVLGWSYLGGLVLATVVVPPVNFLVNWLWCFRKVAPPAG